MISQVAAMLKGGAPIVLCPGELQADTAVLLATSGSTGRPKPISLSREQLVAAARATTDFFGWSATWHLALPSHYIAGLMVIVRGLLGNGLQECGSNFEKIQLAPGKNVISVVPTQLVRALREGIKLDGFDAVLVGGAALDPGLRTKAEQAGIRVIETYGMTETCGGVVYDGEPLPGVRVSLDGERICLAGPMVLSGLFRTPDRGEFVDGKLRVLGRCDDVVITGGLKADLAAVRRRVLAVDEEAWVLAIPDEEWGQKIVLFAQGDLASWRSRLAEHLPKHALPRELIQIDHVPRTAGGKPDRSALLRLLTK